MSDNGGVDDDNDDGNRDDGVDNDDAGGDSDDGDGDDDDDDDGDRPEGFFCLPSIAPLIVLSTQQGYTQCLVCVHSLKLQESIWPVKK